MASAEITHGHIPMIVDKANPILWDRTEVPSLDGLLYTAPECPDNVAAQILAIAGNQTGAFNDARILSMNDQRSVVADGEYVHKIKYQAGQDHTLGLSAVRATVALEEGLKRVPQPSPDDQLGIGPHYYAAAQMFGAFIPDNHRSRSRQVITMSREQGDVPTREQLPPPPTRQAHYAAAIASTGLAPELVMLDDAFQNMAIRHDAETGKLRIARFDISAMIDYREAGIF